MFYVRGEGVCVVVMVVMVVMVAEVDDSKINILPACHVQMPTISMINY